MSNPDNASLKDGRSKYLAGLIAGAGILYLGMRGGGYAATTFRPLVIALWLAVTWFGWTSRERIGREAAVTLGLAFAMTALTTVSVLWTDSFDGALADTARAFLYLGVLALVTIGVVGRQMRRAVAAGASGAICVVALVALAVRLLPETFGLPVTAELMSEARGQLSYPLNYWNGLASLIALGVPLLVAQAAHCERVIRSLCVGLLPTLMLTIFLTGSRGGALAAIAGTLTVFAISTNRARVVVVVALGAVAGSGLIAFALRQDAVRNGLGGSDAQSQGVALLIVLLICTGVVAAISTVAFRSSAQSDEQSTSRPLPQAGVIAVGLALIAGLVGITGVVAAGHDDQSAATSTSAKSSQFASASGRGRSALWHAGLRAAEDRPVAGHGAGSFEQWWAAAPELGPSARNAHSVFVEFAAELGAIGLALIVALLASGVWLAGRAFAVYRPYELVGATGGLVAFLVLLSLDWSWEMPVVSITGFLLLGVLASARQVTTASAPRRLLGIGAGLIAAVSSLVTLPAHLAQTQVRASQQASQAGDSARAMEAAERAVAIMPNSSEALIQQALVLKASGQRKRALGVSHEIVATEPGNWRAWLTLAAAAADAGEQDLALSAYRTSRSLNRHGSAAPVPPND